MSESIPFCETKQVTCPAFTFGSQIAEEPGSFELRDTIAQANEVLSPCNDCPYKLIGEAALIFKKLMESGELAKLTEYVTCDEMDTATTPQWCKGCPQNAHRDKPDDKITVNGITTTMLEHYGQDYFDERATEDKLIAPYTRVCPGRVETKAYEDDNGDISREQFCPAAVIAAYNSDERPPEEHEVWVVHNYAG